MTTVTVDCGPGEASDLVRQAFERTDAIRLYHVGTDRAVGKTGTRRFNWGERVVVEIAANGQGGTDLSVRQEDEVDLSFGWSATPLEPQVVDTLRTVADLTGDGGFERLPTDGEVESVSSLPSGTVAAGLFVGVVFTYVFASNALTEFEVLELLDGPLSYGLLALWYAFICTTALLVVWLYEGTLKQRLPT